MASKPSLDEVHGFLRERQSLIAHFSGVPKGAGRNQQPYPNDLLNVIADRAQGGLSCSVVTATDDFGAPNGPTIGSIGVIVAPTGAHSIMAVSHRDAGSSEVDGVRTYPDLDIGIQDLRDSLDLRTGYNEWGLRDYKVVAIVAVPPVQVSRTVPSADPVDVSLQQVQDAFPSLRLVIPSGGKWVLLDAEQTLYA